MADTIDRRSTPAGPGLPGLLWLFVRRILGNFSRNHGLLLASGVGYNVLLSAVPLLAVLAAILTTVIDRQELLSVMTVQMAHISPTNVNLLLDAVRQFMDNKQIVGIIAFPVLLFFSTFAFRMLEQSISIIFHEPEQSSRRFWVSLVLPYAFIGVLGLGLTALTIMFAVVSAIYEEPGLSLYFLSFFGVFITFSAFYKVLPIVRISKRRAVIGGLVAAVLWEATRAVLLYYFANVSLVGAIYGSFATIIVILISLEIGAVILLLGAEVIAELERCARVNKPWYSGAIAAKTAVRP